jgi:hypothetical protein
MNINIHVCIYTYT